jgi:hypothetical protein
MGSTVIGVALACAASLLFNAGIAIQALEVRQVPPEHGLRISLLGRLVRRRRWLAGTALAAGAVPLQVGANLLAPLTAVQPADAAGLLLLLYLGSRVLGERVGVREVGAVVAIVGGITLLTAVAPEREVTHVGVGEGLLPLAVVALVALAPIALRRSLGPASLVVVFGAGFAFALSAFAIKLMADAIDRGSWAALVSVSLAAAGGALAGTLTEQTALQRRPATQVAPIIFVVELLVPVALAVVVVGEDWRGDAAPIAVALALIVAGVVALARAPQVARLLGSGGG